MAIKRQTWRPDTHPEYDIVEEYDTVDYDATVTVVGVKLNGVEQFMTPAARSALRQSLKASNNKKNTALAEVFSLVPASFKKEVLDGETPTGTFVLKDEYVIRWERTGDSTYVLRAVFLTQQQVNQANTWLTNKGITGVTVTNAVN